MTIFYAWVDPGNASDIATVDLDGTRLQWTSGRSTVVRLPIDGGAQSRTFALGPAPAPVDFDVYEVLKDTTSTPTYSEGYYTRSPSYSLVGPVRDVASRVQESINFVQIPIDELRDLKHAEADRQLSRVLSANAQSSLLANWVVIVDNTQRTWIASVNGFLQDRMRDRVYDADPKPYWARDVPLNVINTTTQRQRREDFDEAQWGTIMKDIGLHDFAATDADNLVRNDIETAPTWEALAAIDVTEASYGWPPVYTGPVTRANGA